MNISAKYIFPVSTYLKLQGIKQVKFGKLLSDTNNNQKPVIRILDWLPFWPTTRFMKGGIIIYVVCYT
ncbi:hypothetical protein BBR47_02980 [Brevibacillus brevis NBRC 100599]|uniref:Uncharacterized protein n=1 Tax=Brevibacillus brevis (strain 47 / JCM 6285 / NBRC 100599) TaxID=358681 RepID=C0ZIQ7_BREBN|nr:hypothetical protein BBR47_02980 [Brevibacillus brevis NBRC 100599]